MENMEVVDGGVERVVRVMEEFFEHDGKTSYIFTSDHGMTDWGASSSLVLSPTQPQHTPHKHPQPSQTPTTPQKHSQLSPPSYRLTRSRPPIRNSNPLPGMGGWSDVTRRQTGHSTGGYLAVSLPLLGALQKIYFFLLIFLLVIFDFSLTIGVR